MTVLPWIQKSERVVGKNSTVYSDTLNRALRQVLLDCGLDPDQDFPGLAPVYNAHAYGIGVGTGSDDTAAFQAAINAASAAGGGVVTGMRGKTYKLLELSLPSYVTLDLGGINVTKNAGVSTTVVVRLNGTVTATTTALTTDGVIVGSGADGTPLSVSSSAGFNVGDWVVLYDNTYKYGTSGRNQEINRVYAVGVGTITLASRLIGKYTVANGATIAKLAPVVSARVRGGTITITSGATSGGGVYGTYCIDCVVEGATIYGTNDLPGIAFKQSLACRAKENTVRDGQSRTSSGKAYAIQLDESSCLCVIENNHIANCREVPVTNNTRQSMVVDNVIESNEDSGINTHGSGCEHILIARNTINGSRGPGIIAGFTGSNSFDTDITIAGNIVLNTGGDGINTWGSSTTVRSQRIVIIDNIVKGWGVNSTLSWSGVAVGQADWVVVRDNILDGLATNPNPWRGVFVQDAKNVSVTDNRIDNIPGGEAIQWFTTCNNLLVARNRIGTTSGGNFRASAPASSNVLIKDNVCDMSAVGTVAGTERFENNVYGFSGTNKYEHNRGLSGAIADGGVIAHGLRSTPTSVRLTATVAGQIATVSALDATNITVAIKTGAGAAGTAQSIHWDADCS